MKRHSWMISASLLILLGAPASFARTPISKISRTPASSSELVKKIKAAYEANGDDAFRGRALGKKDLKGDALKFFAKMMKDFGSDYPPVAVLTNFAGTEVVYIVDNNDGGSYWGFYESSSGKEITGGSQGESGDPTWDN